MLQIELGNSSSRDCSGVSRREFLQVGALGCGGLALSDLLALKANGQLGDGIRDKSVVVLFLTGGPSQIETFDPKMDAAAEIRSVTGELQTTIPGITFGGTFSRLAKLAHRLSVVRSFTHGQADHTMGVEQVIRAGNSMNAGMGAIVSRLRGSSHPSSGLPTNVYLTAKESCRQFNKERLRLSAAASGGHLGSSYSPFEVGGDGQLNRNLRLNIPKRRLNQRLELRKSLDSLRRKVDGRGDQTGMNKFEQQALDLILGKSRAAFDLSTEDPKLVEKYDTSRFSTGIHAQRSSTLGHQLLLARRLCEAGCGFITVHNPGRDMHGGPTQYNMPHGMNSLGRPVDHAVGAFLDDVESRGLRDEILLVITGEFGRTPRVKKNGGRDHWPRLSTLAFAGGGLPGGTVVGQSDSIGGEPRSDPVTLGQMFGSILHVLFDVSKLRLRSGLPREVLSLLETNEPIKQLV